MSPSAKRTKIEKVDTGIEEKEDAQQTQKEQQELLKGHYELLPDILSFVIQNTADFAYLRLVSKSWNQHVLPYCLGLSCKNKTNGIYLEPYFRDKQFLNELVGSIEEDPTCAGMLYESSSPSGLDIFRIFGEEITIQSLLIIGGSYQKGNFRWTKEEMESTETANLPQLFDLLHSTKDEKQFWSSCKTLLSSGKFLSIQDYESKKMSFLNREIPCEGCYSRDKFVVILTVKSLHEDVVFDASDEEYDDYVMPIYEVEAHWRMDDIPDDKAALVLSSCYFEQEKDFKGIPDCTFRGYVVEEDPDESTVTYRIPMALVIDTDWLEKSDYKTSYIPLTSIWHKYQTSPAREGIAIADGILPDRLHDSLMTAIDEFAETQEVDYHPHSRGIVRDIVHPALYSFVKGVSPMNSSLSVDDVPPAIPMLTWDGSNNVNLDYDGRRYDVDYWGRSYEASSKYQWLPTYFDIDMNGKCTICDYINNLVPRSNHEVMYSLLSQVFNHALPLLESVVSYGRSMRPYIRSKCYDEDDTYPTEIPKERVSFRGKRLQVITKIVDYELAPGETYTGVWHVEGMSHEEIVATVLYFEREDEIKGGNILFKRAFHGDEAWTIRRNTGQSRPAPYDPMIKDGLAPLGQVDTISRRLLVFPNSHIHKVDKLENIDPVNGSDSKKRKRRLIVFFLVNPSKRIISTREVPMQQEPAGGTMSRDDAFKHRLELMKERKYTKQDWNVREIELCEH